MPTLFVVATPIGNLEDISLRALRTLREVTLIAAEDTRQTRRLLKKYEITTPMTSYHEHNKESKLDYILDKCLEGDVALVSDAGTPGISDPGYELILAAGQRNIDIVPLPGPSAVTTALAVSGLPTDRFTFLGFLPRKSGERKTLLETAAGETGTLIVMEAPHRLSACLHDILKILGDRRIAVCRELTKIHEEIFRGTISEAIDHFSQPKGEFTLVIQGRGQDEKPRLTAEIEAYLNEMRHSGIKAKEAIAKVAGETGISRKELYRVWLGRTLKNEEDDRQ